MLTKPGLSVIIDAIRTSHKIFRRMNSYATYRIAETIRVLIFLTPEWSHENPMDIVGDAGADRYARVFDVMISNQDKWDITFVIAVPSGVLDSRHLAQEIVRFSNHTHKMIVGCLLGGNSMKSGVHILRKASIPNFSELEEAFDAVGKALSLR